jgi:hypothetical protein
MTDRTEGGFEGLGSLIQLVGVNVPARARFIGETRIGATLSSVTFGLVCGQFGAVIPAVGPLLPFLCGSWFGYTFGLVGQWVQSKKLVKTYAEKYPELLLHSLEHQWHIDVPKSVSRGGIHDNKELLQDWIFSGGLGRISMSIIAAQSCRIAVEEIQQKGRERVVEQFHENSGFGEDDE